jgi:hypothetical protein
VIAPDVAPAELREARAVLGDARVRACTLATGIKLASGLAGADDLRRMVDIATELGCGQIRVFPGGSLDKPDLDAMVALVHASIDYATDRGVRIGIETHDSVKSGRAVAALAARVDHPAFGIVWDMVHTAVAGESPLDAWRAVCSRLVEVQVKTRAWVHLPSRFCWETGRSIGAEASCVRWMQDSTAPLSSSGRKLGTQNSRNPRSRYPSSLRLSERHCLETTARRSRRRHRPLAVSR